jgi:hypothetical protein
LECKYTLLRSCRHYDHTITNEDQSLTLHLSSFFFLISILFQVLLARHHKREKRFGPSPANNYTYGTGRKWWGRKKNNPEASGGVDTLPTHPTPADIEMGGEKQPQKNWFGSWGKNKHAAATGTHATGPQNGYGYGGSAYTGNI